jgi:hypothetical protein
MRFPAATAARIFSTATVMSPSRKGSCGSISPRTKRRASSTSA